MRRRDFAIGLGASGIAGRALGQVDEGNSGEFQQFARIRLRLPPNLNSHNIYDLVFVVGGSTGIAYDLTRDFLFRNDDRLTIQGMSPPTALQEADEAQFLAPVYYDEKSLICAPPIRIREAQTVVTISDGQSTFLIGGLLKLDSEQKSNLPWIGDLPLVGAMFRSKTSTAAREELLILVHPSIIDRD